MLAVILYTYFGYPIILGVLATVWPRKARLGEEPPTPPFVTVCLPVHNGAAFIAKKMESLLGQDYPAERYEILVYSDGCDDGTNELVEQIAAGQEAGRVRLLKGDGRHGKPTGLNRLREEARGDLLLLNDVRQPLVPHALTDLVAAFRDPEVGCATGNLQLEGTAGSGLYWRYENWIRRQESRFRSVVGMTGPIGMVRKADLAPVPLDIILDDVWVPMQVRRTGRRVVLVESAVAVDQAFEDEREWKRKIRTLAGNYQIFFGQPWMLSPVANPSFFETFSHKILRLVTAWLLPLLLVLSLVGALRPGGGWVALLFVGQVAFYAGAFLGPKAGKVGVVARTFVMMNAAALLGFFRYLSGRQRVTW